MAHEELQAERCYRHPGEETRVRCSNCERPICTRCMIDSPVGIRCPECAGRGARTRVIRPRALGGGTPYVLYALLALNVLGFVVSGGGSLSTEAFRKGALFGPGVADGEWWRIVTSAFLHANIIHIAFNMYALWLLGSMLERYVGSVRFAAVYAVGVVSGSAGALLMDPNTLTVGASGAVFALLGALLVLERQGTMLVGPVLPILVLNLVFTFAVPNISIGGHLGGLVGGILATLALSRFGQGHVAYGRLGLTGPLLLLAIVAADLLVIAYSVG